MEGNVINVCINKRNSYKFTRFSASLALHPASSSPTDQSSRLFPGGGSAGFPSATTRIVFLLEFYPSLASLIPPLSSLPSSPLAAPSSPPPSCPPLFFFSDLFSIQFSSRRTHALLTKFPISLFSVSPQTQANL